MFGLVRNLFDQHYAVSGTFFDVTSYPYLNLTDPRTFTPGIPFAAYVGVRGTLPSGGPAFAADAPRPTVTKAPLSVGPELRRPSINWTGVYLGINGGFSFGGSYWTDSVTGISSGNFGTSGFVFGGTLGANYQAGSLVFGVEADGDWADASGFGTFTATSLCAGGCLTKQHWLATVRGRAGYAIDHSLDLRHRRRSLRRRSAPTSPTIPSAARPKPAGLPAPASSLHLRRIGRPRRNISSSIWPMVPVRQIAHSKFQWTRFDPKRCGQI